MAKKQQPPAEATDKPEATAAPAEQAKPAEGKKPKEPKGKAAAAEAPAAPPAPAAAPGEPTSQKKKGRQPGKPPRRGKKLREKIKSAVNKATKEGPLPLKKAIGLLKSVKRAKFDETVEVHMSLGIDTTQSEQMIRGSVPLPHGLGKVKRVVVFCQGDNVAKARDAGADFAGGDELYVNYGSPAAGATLNRLIVKFLFHAGADVGT